MRTEPRKLTDAAWQRGGVAPVTGTTRDPIQKWPTVSDGARANAGESPAIGQPFAFTAGWASTPFPSPARAVLPRRSLASHAQVSRVRPAKVGSWASSSEIFELPSGAPTGPATPRRSA